MLPRVSLCLIVKDEEASLPSCLASVADLVDDIVIVDTGSADRSREIAAEFRACVIDFAWTNSFADARNECLRHARGGWIFSIDADEYLDESNRVKLRTLFENLEDDNLAYNFRIRCPLAPGRGPPVIAEQVRLFRNRPEHRWQYRVHEQILPALRSTGASCRDLDVLIQHSGYIDPGLSRAKLERNLALLRLDHDERPDDPFILRNLGWTYLDLGRAGDALPFLQRGRALSESDPGNLLHLYALEVHCLQQLGKLHEASALCQLGRARYSQDSSLLFQEALLRHQQNDLGGAERCLRQLLNPQHVSTGIARIGCAFEGLHGFLARHHLGLVLLDQGRRAEAETEWQAVLAEQPAYVPAEIELAKLFLQENRENEAEKVMREILKQDPSQVDCWCNLAKVLRNQNRLPAVLEVCREARKHFPDEPDLVRLHEEMLTAFRRNDVGRFS
jgi:tetratricopeptide (TPR) repeat protein